VKNHTITMNNSTQPISRIFRRVAETMFLSPNERDERARQRREINRRIENAPREPQSIPTPPHVLDREELAVWLMGPNHPYLPEGMFGEFTFVKFPGANEIMRLEQFRDFTEVVETRHPELFALTVDYWEEYEVDFAPVEQRCFCLVFKGFQLARILGIFLTVLKYQVLSQLDMREVLILPPIPSRELKPPTVPSRVRREILAEQESRELLGSQFIPIGDLISDQIDHVSGLVRSVLHLEKDDDTGEENPEGIQPIGHEATKQEEVITPPDSPIPPYLEALMAMEDSDPEDSDEEEDLCIFYDCIDQ
jgi:hypothetical protein